MKSIMEKERVKSKMMNSVKLIIRNWRAYRNYKNFRLAMIGYRTVGACVVI